MRKYFCVFTLIVCTVLLTACGRLAAEKEGNRIITDSIGREVELELPVKRAVVANSHNTELINSIGNSIDKVVGVDSGIFYDKAAYKGRFKEYNLIGQNQRALNYEKIINLHPDVLIISDNGCWQEAENKLKDFGIKVIVLNAYHTADFKKNCFIVGRLFGEEESAGIFYRHFHKYLDYVEKQLKDKPKKTVYFEYRNAGTTIIPNAPYYKMAAASGGKNIFDDARSPYVDSEAVIKRNPQYIVKISEKNARGQYTPPGLDELRLRKQRIIERAGWDEIEAVKRDNILVLSHYAFDGASEIVGALYIAKFLYPEYLPDLHPEQVFKEWVTNYQHLEYKPGHTYPAFDIYD